MPTIGRSQAGVGQATWGRNALVSRMNWELVLESSGNKGPRKGDVRREGGNRISKPPK